MTESMRNVWVGLFVVTGLVALGVLMVWFGETPTWLGGNEWTLRITDVRELRGVGDGSPVYLNGVEIGRVKALEFENPERPDHGVVVMARINNRYSVPRGAFAKVYGATLGFGAGRIEILVEPGRGLELLPREGAQIQGEMRSFVGEVVSKEFLDALERAIIHIGDLTEKWTPVGENLALLLEQRGVDAIAAPGARERGLTPNLTTAVERIDTLVANLNTVLGDAAVQDDVKSAVRDLKGAAQQVRGTIELWNEESRKLADNLNAGVDRTEENLDRSFAHLTRVLDRVDDAATSLASVLQSTREGKGTAGMFFHDPRLYESAVLSLDRLAEALGTLQRILGKIERDGYITVGQAPSGMLRKDFPVPGASGPAPRD